MKCDSCGTSYEKLTEIIYDRAPDPNFLLNDLTLENILIVKHMYCANCIRRYGWVCCNGRGKTCENAYHSTSATRLTINGIHMCVVCYIHNFLQCTRCLTTFNRNIVTNDTIAIKEEGYCVNCLAAIDAVMIKEFNYKPRAKFYKSIKEEDSPLFYGIELEVNCAEDMASSVLKVMNKSHVYLKHDGSIGVGFEIVTHPHTYSAQKELWKAFFAEKYHLKGVTSYKSKRCGMHIHLSRNAFTSEHLARFVVFINSRENVAFIEAIAQRKGGQWAKIDTSKTLNNIPAREKYEAVNLLPKNTIEIRIFRGSTRKDRFFKNLEFTDSLYYYTANSTKLDYRSYIEWIENNKKTKYPYLFKFLKEKEFIKEEGVECQKSDKILTIVTE